MTKIRIRSNPYTRRIEYYTSDNEMDWSNISSKEEKSALRDIKFEKSYFPFRTKEIIDIIIKEYYVGRDKVQLCFDGTLDEYKCVQKYCEKEGVKDKIECTKTTSELNDANTILNDIEKSFGIISELLDDLGIKNNKEYLRVKQTLENVVPICIFGDKGVGKSTFINTIIGVDILPSGVDTTTAKVYEIKKANSDVGRIIFEYKGDTVTLIIKEDGIRQVGDEANTDLLDSIEKEVNKCLKNNVLSTLGATLNTINALGNEDKENLIGDLVVVEVPFEKKEGIYIDDSVNYIVFDIPSFDDCNNKKILTIINDELEGLRNAIPIWVTQYNELGKDKNRDAYEKLLSLNCMDRRFSKIIFNKADISNLPDDRLFENDERNIIEDSIVEKIFEEGIYFVSLLSSSSEIKKSNKLYKYNIAPDVVKSGFNQYCSECNDSFLVDSGLLCVEKELDKYINYYSSYNKCQCVYDYMNYMFDEVINDVKKEADDQKNNICIYEKELGDKEIVLKETLDKISKEVENVFYSDSKNELRIHVNAGYVYKISLDELSEVASEARTLCRNANSIDELGKKEYEESKNKLWERLSKNGQEVFSKKFFGAVKNLSDDLFYDIKDVADKKGRMDDYKKGLDIISSEAIMNYITGQYRRSVCDFYSDIKMYLEKYWEKKENQLKKEIEKEITKLDILSKEQQCEMVEMISVYKSTDYYYDIDKVFVKKDFLQGSFLGIRFFDSERLDLKKLVNKYNDEISNVIIHTSSEMNDRYYDRFLKWKYRIIEDIKLNIVRYNPELKQIAEKIDAANIKIYQLEDNEHRFVTEYNKVKDMVDYR